MSNTRAVKAVPAAPDDGEFDLDTWITERDLAPYRFRFSGKSWELPNLAELDVWTMIAAAESGDISAVERVMSKALGERWEEFRAISMPADALNALFARYVKHSGMAPGERQASTGS